MNKESVGLGIRAYVVYSVIQQSFIRTHCGQNCAKQGLLIMNETDVVAELLKDIIG
jgi:3-isopropylmalate dehydratase small subunit